MSESKTPRTDKAEYTVRLGKHNRKVVRPELCRQLETELAEVTRQRDRLAEALVKYRGQVDHTVDANDMIADMKGGSDE